MTRNRLEKTNFQEKALEAFKKGEVKQALDYLEEEKKGDSSKCPKLTLALWFTQVKDGGPRKLAPYSKPLQPKPGHPEVLLVNASFALAEGRLTDTILSLQTALNAADNARWNAEQKKRYRAEARKGLVEAFGKARRWCQSRYRHGIPRAGLHSRRSERCRVSATQG